MCNKLKQKYIFVTGGVISSVGKSVIASSIGVILDDLGKKVGILKFNPYLNIDLGVINSLQYKKEFIINEGDKVDFDLSNYERFMSNNLIYLNNITAGQIYKNVLKKEKLGKYLGETVQIIPHITDEIKFFIYNTPKDCDILICEIGGTVGDIESLPFLETIRQIKSDLLCNSIHIHVSYVPEVSIIKKFKTKPTQNSVKELLNIGIQSDIIILRSKKKVSEFLKKKISLLCNIEYENVIGCNNLSTIYNIPSLLKKNKLDKIIFKKFKFKKDKIKLIK